MNLVQRYWKGRRGQIQTFEFVIEGALLFILGSSELARLLVRFDHVASEPICRSRKNESFRGDKRYLMVKRMLAVLPSLTTLMM